jgi:ADP-ribose diphosphatase
LSTVSDDDAVEVLGVGRYVRLVRRHGWEHTVRPGVRGIVVLVAVTPAGELLLVEQHREAVRAPVIELPSGLVGDEPGKELEPLEEAASRELLEETGWEASSWERLSTGPPSSGVSSEIVTLLRARELVQRGPGGGTGSERITVHAVPLASISEWLLDRESAGHLVDPKVWAGVWFATR